ncbi:MAG: hypothetical protein ACFWTJ_12300 [Lachnoclostridium sp.]
MAVLVGLIFMNLYKENMKESYQNRLKKQAESISRKLAERIINNDDESYLEYLELLEEMDTDKPDIWTISNPNAKNPMDKKLQNINLEDVKLSEDCVEVIRAALQGITMYASGYYEEFGGKSAILGRAVIVNGEVVGAILLRSSIEAQEEILRTSTYLIFLSVGVALFISVVIAVLFAKGLTAPILKMRKTALELANGNMTVRQIL